MLIGDSTFDTCFFQSVLAWVFQQQCGDQGFVQAVYLEGDPGKDQKGSGRWWCWRKPIKYVLSSRLPGWAAGLSVSRDPQNRTAQAPELSHPRGMGAELFLLPLFPVTGRGCSQGTLSPWHVLALAEWAPRGQTVAKGKGLQSGGWGVPISAPGNGGGWGTWQNSKSVCCQRWASVLSR